MDAKATQFSSDEEKTIETPTQKSDTDTEDCPEDALCGCNQSSLSSREAMARLLETFKPHVKNTVHSEDDDDDVEDDDVEDDDEEYTDHSDSSSDDDEKPLVTVYGSELTPGTSIIIQTQGKTECVKTAERHHDSTNHDNSKCTFACETRPEFWGRLCLGVAILSSFVHVGVYMTEAWRHP